ncbi:MAG: hypothetical protein H8E98_06215 [Bacteroidetes bacterium]|nr:hypothetical protein [Bacteroidota bacterium]
MKLKNLLKEEKLVEATQKTFGGIKFNVRYYPKDNIINFTTVKSGDKPDESELKPEIASYLSKKLNLKINPINTPISGINFKLYDNDIEELIFRQLK